MDVPLMSPYVPLFKVEKICPPGAVISGFIFPSGVKPQLEKYEILPAFLLAPNTNFSENFIFLSIFSFKKSPSSLDTNALGILA